MMTKEKESNLNRYDSFLCERLKFLITFLKNVITHSYKRYNPEMLVDSDGYDKLRVDHLEEDLIKLSKYIVVNHKT